MVQGCDRHPGKPDGGSGVDKGAGCTNPLLQRGAFPWETAGPSRGWVLCMHSFCRRRIAAMLQGARWHHQVSKLGSTVSRRNVVGACLLPRWWSLAPAETPVGPAVQAAAGVHHEGSGPRPLHWESVHQEGR